MSKPSFLGGISKSLRGPDMLPIDDSLPAPEDRRSMLVGVHDVDIYEYNPRLVESETFGDLVYSIWMRGLDQVISVTRRPGSERLLLRAGAGSRITALRLLLELTKDERQFGSFDATFVPWVSELDTLMAHSSENLTREGLKFIEMARHERRISEVIQQEDPSFKNLALRPRALRYGSAGFKTYPRTLQLYDYVNDRLLPHFEQALLHGKFGDREIQAIIKLEKSLANPVHVHDPDLAAKIPALFTATLKANDRKDATVTTLRDDVLRRLGKKLGISPEAVLQAPLAKQSAPAADSPGPTSAADARLVAPDPGSPTHLSTDADSSPAATDEPLVVGSEGAPYDAHDSGATPPGELALEGFGDDPFSSEPVSTAQADSPSSPTHDDPLLQIRDEATDLVDALANEYGLTPESGVFFAAPDIALGFGISSPDPADLLQHSCAIDAIVVHRELHGIFWSLLLAEHRCGRVSDQTVSHFSEGASPEHIVRSHTYQSVNAVELHWRMRDLRTRGADHDVTGNAPREHGLIQRIDSLNALADEYVRQLMTAR